MELTSFTEAQLRTWAPGPETALAIGVFDGVHLGHQALVRRVADEARKRALSPGIVTLHPHPMTVLRPEMAPSYLTSLDDRIALIREAGAAWVLPLTFTSEVAELECEDLVRAFSQFLRMRLMVLGPDAAFGRGAPKDTPERVRRLSDELGFEVLQLDALMHDHERYSSTAVRNALAAGDMTRVTALLGRPYRLAGPVIKGFERGRTIGFPTANISVAADRAMPALGVYATRAHVAGRTLPGATNIGRRPTFDAGHVSIETHLIDFEGDIYGERLELELLHRLRAERAFASPDELVKQIARDVEQARVLLG